MGDGIVMTTLEPGPVDKLLGEIEADPTCIFWGWQWTPILSIASPITAD